MAFHNETLHTLIGRVKDAKPMIDYDKARQFLNDAVRHTISRRSYWADLSFQGIVSVPNAHETGTVTLTRGSAAVVGTGTAWPVSDVANTTLATDVDGDGYQEVQLADMTGIVDDVILLVDAGTGQEEAVPVGRVKETTLLAKFTKPHDSGATVQVSSLAGLQFRLGSGHPIFTVLGVTSTTGLLLDKAWGGASAIGSLYMILKMYHTMSASLRNLELVVDQRQGTPLDSKILTQKILATRDPQRMAVGDPQSFIPFTISPGKNPQYELYPAPHTERQISWLGTQNWPEMVDSDDVPPPFIDPVLFVKRAQAEALRLNMTNGAVKDPWYDPRMAEIREREYERMLEVNMQDDENRHAADFQLNAHNMMYGGAGMAYAQSHLTPDEAWF